MALTLISLVILVILHGEMFVTISRSYRLVKGGIATTGRMTRTHETGWWQSTGEYGWTYIRRCYADYIFVGPDGYEKMSHQLVLGAVDLAKWTSDHPVTVFYDAENVNSNVMIEACPFRPKDITIVRNQQQTRLN